MYWSEFVFLSQWIMYLVLFLVFTGVVMLIVCILIMFYVIGCYIDDI